MTHKYKIGQRLKFVSNDGDSFEHNKIYTVTKSKRYPETYGFKDVDDEGYLVAYVECKKFFVPADINNWAEHIKNLR